MIPQLARFTKMFAECFQEGHHTFYFISPFYWSILSSEKVKNHHPFINFQNLWHAPFKKGGLKVDYQRPCCILLCQNVAYLQALFHQYLQSLTITITACIIKSWGQSLLKMPKNNCLIKRNPNYRNRERMHYQLYMWMKQKGNPLHIFKCHTI